MPASGHLTSVCGDIAAAHCDLRFPDIDWRSAHPNLDRLHEKDEASLFAETVPPRPSPPSDDRSAAEAHPALETITLWLSHRPLGCRKGNPAPGGASMDSISQGASRLAKAGLGGGRPVACARPETQTAPRPTGDRLSNAGCS